MHRRSTFDRCLVVLSGATMLGWLLAAVVAMTPLFDQDPAALLGPAALAWAGGGAAWALLLAVHGLALGLLLAHLWRMPRLSARRKVIWVAGLAGTGPVAMSLYWALHVRGLHRRAPARGWPHAEFMPSGQPLTLAD